MLSFVLEKDPEHQPVTGDSQCPVCPALLKKIMQQRQQGLGLCVASPRSATNSGAGSKGQKLPEPQAQHTRGHHPGCELPSDSQIHLLSKVRLGSASSAGANR